ncbi:hypothetical protein BN1050_00270 [Metalysinibacillus saudimassiliensis]|uniref:UDP-glucose 4-epimerase n=1 Tax=Metalysinibacillus saudimassiliensis TaxID=1461583 RepID=A0A078M3E5_9BACL|nr:hypothetical protein BN1050_00270 [Metalysinibacillus saudimassiliensis]
MVERVVATDKVVELIQFLKDKHQADIVFHQSGGCCEGSKPMCFLADEFRLGQVDRLLGYVAGDVPFYMHESLYNYSKHTQHILDVVDSFGSGFSIEALEGKSFLIRARVFSDDEYEEVKKIIAQEQ